MAQKGEVKKSSEGSTPDVKKQTRKKETEVTSESIANKITGLEEEIASISLRLSELERAIEPIEIETISLLKIWTEQENITDEEEKLKRKNKIKDLCEKERSLESEYVRQSQDLDSKVFKLRLLYLDYINQVNEEKKNPPAKGKAKPTITVSVHQSSLISGSSSGIDDVNYNRIFRKWEFDTNDISKPEETTPYSLKRTSTIFEVEEVVVMNKEVCLKRIANPKLNQKEKDLIIGDHKHSKDLLGHPNLLTYIGAVVENGKEAVIVELARNKVRSLQDVLQSQKIAVENEKNKIIRLGFPRKLSIMKKVASALAWLHEKHKKTAVTLYHYQHLRLKPSNILFTSDWNVKVSDYGLNYPKFVNPEIFTDEVLFEQYYVHYSAPELFEEPKPNHIPNAYCDSWSLGMIYYTLLTDKIPFEDCKSYDEIKLRISEKKLPNLPENTSPKLKQIILDCWQYEPTSRPTPLTIVESNPWATIFTEASTEGSKNAHDIWNSAVAKSDGDKKSMPWDKFAPVLWERLHLDKRKNMNDSDEAICLKDLLRVTREGHVFLDKFSEFAKTFSPLRCGPSEGPAYVTSIVKLCKSGWFYGVKDRQATNAILNTEEAKKSTKSGKINGIVLRLSANENFQFCYGEIMGGQIYHSLVGPKNYEQVDFYEYFEKEIKKKDRVSIKVTSENPYQKIVDKNYKPLKVRVTKIATDNSVLNRSTQDSRKKK